MRKEKIRVLCLALAIGIFIAASGFEAQAWSSLANEVIVMAPGDPDQVRSFYLCDIFDIQNLGPAQSYIVLAIGDNETKCGKLSISLSTAAKSDFGAVMDFSLAGFAFSLDEGASVISASASTPSKAAKDITINSTFGFAYAAAMIKDIRFGDFELPAPFTVTFKLAKQEKK